VHSDEGLFQGIKRGRVDHLLLNLGRVRAPRHKEQLGSVRSFSSLGLLDVVVIVNGISAVVIFSVLDLQIAHKLVVIVVTITGLVESDFSVGNFENGVPEFLVLLDGLVGVGALIRQFHAGHRHFEGLIILPV